MIVLVLSLIVVRVATVALSMTGLPIEVSRFQARSAWTGTGFTTVEAEQVVGHPVRRRILSWLMLARGAGLVTAASTLFLSFTDVGDQSTREGLFRLGVLLAALIVLWYVSRSGYVDRLMRRWIEKALEATTELGAKNYATVLHLDGGYRISEIEVDADGWLAGRTLRDLKLASEGVVVLGVTRESGRYVGAPAGDVKIRAGDRLTVYAEEGRVRELSDRRSGWSGAAEHIRSEREERERREKQEASERAMGDG
jgi:hypothetical protein